MNKRLYRQAALDRAASPERLDELARVTGSAAWAALLALLALLGGVVAWSFLGTVPSHVEGRGILLDRGGAVFEAVAPETGVVGEILVGIDDTVAEGQLVARLSQRETGLELTEAEAAVAEQRERLERLRGDAAQRDALRAQAVERRIAAAREQLDTATTRLGEAETALGNARDLFGRGLSTVFRVRDASDIVDGRRREMSEARERLAEAEREKVEGDLAEGDRLAEAEVALSEAERRLYAARDRLARGSRVLAPRAGRVTEIRAAPGQVLPRGEPLASFETVGDELELVLFVPPSEGKRVRPGMPVRLSPDTARREEFGSVLGTVADISAFPSTRDGVAAVLRNEELVRAFFESGPPYRATVRLDRDGESLSGYAWTSEKGRALDLTSGTLGSAEVLVREQRPISLALPLLREWTGL